MPNVNVLPLRERAQVRNRWLSVRLDEVLPALMAREGFDLWIIAARENNEDPVIMTMLPEPMMAARRRTILLFFRRPDGGVDRYVVSRYGLGEYYEAVWDPDGGDEWSCVGRLVAERDPKVIGVDVSHTFAYGDGLTHSEYELLMKSLGSTYALRCRGAERLAVGWLEWRTRPEEDAYPGIVRIAHEVVAEAFSGRVIHPGVTTADDVVWWVRQRFTDLGLRAWFQPTISVQAEGLTDPGPGAAAARPKADRTTAAPAAPTPPTPPAPAPSRRRLILPGDVLHCDVGLVYLGLCTDTQQNAYVRRSGETDAPAGLKAALAVGNRFQDITVSQFVAGRTGNQILAGALERAAAEGIKASLYTHPLGYHGHAAGPTIGLWDAQGGVPGRGDYELFDHTCHALELNVRCGMPEWGGQEVRMALEEDILFSGGQVHFLDGRQTSLHLI